MKVKVMTRRRKYIIIVAVILFFFWMMNGWYQRQKNRQSVFDKPEFALVERGNLDVPISATGSVEPASRTEIKCKSSGTVLKIYYEAGDKVHKDAKLVELDPVDEKRSLNNARAEVERATASLLLAEAEADQTRKDWPTQVRSTLAELEGVRAALQGAVLEYKKEEALRQGTQGGKQPTIDIINPDEIKHEELQPPGDILNKIAAKDPVTLELIKLCGQEVSISVAEAKSAYKLIESGKKIIAAATGEGYWKGTSAMEYQASLVQMWKTVSQMLASISGVRKAVNMLIMVDQADTKVKLTKEALGQAKVARDQAQQRVDETTVYAPSDGMIQDVFVKKGQIISSGITTVTGGTPLLMLADVSKLYVESDVDEADIGRVRELASVERSARLEFLAPIRPATQPKLTKENEEEMAMLRKSNNVDVTVDAFREQTFTGKVDRVFPNPKNVNNIVTYNVRILLTSPNRTELMLGMHANVKFTSRKLVNILKVANEAIKIKNEERGVYIEGPGNVPMFVPVKVGLTNGTQIELKTDKLKVGDKVYIKLPPSKDEEKKPNEE
jgi:multidrug efflux pump subunit AcrA (membrane-fusion protein)